MQGSNFVLSQDPTAVGSAVARREQLVFRKLRSQLIFSIVGVSLVIYLVTSALALVVFGAGMNGTIEGNLKRLITDCEPAVRLQDGHLSLKSWADNARRENLNIIQVVQLYDLNGNLMEHYGLPGVAKLVNGGFTVRGLHGPHHFRSRYVPVMQAGYLQIQIETKQADDAFAQFWGTMILLIPCVTIMSGVFGYFYSAKAVEPVAKSLAVLRRFVDDAGHELKTPIAVIEASVETLERTLKEHNLQTSVADRIGRASQQLKNLSLSLVLLAKMESPELRLEMSPVPLEQLIAQSLDELSAYAEEHGVKLVSALQAGQTVIGNADSLKRLVLNLIDNAIRYTGDGGTVKVSTQRQNKQIQFMVEDDGPGIPEASLSRIFDRFYRVDESRSHHGGGTGLGLSIAKAIVEAHRGEIRVESKLGAGSCFIVLLPA